MRSRPALSFVLWFPSLLAAQVPLGQEPGQPVPYTPKQSEVPGAMPSASASTLVGPALPMLGTSTPSRPLLLGMTGDPQGVGQKTLYLDEHGPAGKAPGTERWIVTFWQRGFDLGQLRRANYTEAPADQVAMIVAGLEEEVKRDQDQFVKAIQQLGGTVTRQWWIINGCALEIPRTALVVIAALPNVATLEPDRLYEPVIDSSEPFHEPMITAWIQTATNAQNHNADAVQASGLHGEGIGCAIMDTGQDRNMNGTGQPHRIYFLDGIKPGTNLLQLNRQEGAQSDDDTHGHGTGVCGVACGATWNNAGADFGHAYNARKLNYSICDVAGSCSTFDATRVTAWQHIVSDRATYNTRAANNSYAGSPSVTNSVQQALDSAVLNANLLVACAAGNGGSSTTASQACANGLAVAACNPTAKTIAGFSSRGPLSGDTRLFPDITGCGVQTVMPNADSETTNYVADGTSMASPQVCGAAVLVRQANTSLTALETKAVLLASTESIATQNPGLGRNDYGFGFLRDDLAVNLARNNPSVFTDTITQGAHKYYTVYMTGGQTYQFVMTFHRVNFASNTYNDIDLHIHDGGSGGPIIATSNTVRNLYEPIRLVAPHSGNYTIDVYGFTVSSPATDTFAVAHTALTALNHPRPDCHVVPASEADRMSNSNNNIPFSWTPTRYQQVFRGSEVASAPVSLRKLALRQDEAFGGNVGHTVDLEIRLANTTVSHTTITGTFANNLNSGSPTTVVPRTNVVLPVMPAANNNPEEFFVDIPFATPFPFDPTSGRNLLIDVTQRGNSNGNTSFTYPLDAVGFAGATTSRVFGFPDTATTGTVNTNSGLVMCFDGPEQCVIVPLVARNAMGSTNNNIPFSWTPTRYQQVFLASELGVADTFLMVGLRQDEQFANSIGATVDLEVVMGHTTFDETTLTNTFANNITSNATGVVPRRNVVLPNFPAAPNTDPKKALFHIPFDHPFPYNGTSNVVIDITQRGNSRGNATFSYPLDAAQGSGTGTTRLFGFPDTALTGTLGPNYGLVMCFNNTESNAIPGTYDYFGSGCPGGGPGTINTVLPSANAAALGNSNNRFPFGASPQRYQQVFLGSEAPVARQFNALELRQASGQIGHPGYAVDLQIEVGYTTFNPASLTTTFATNFNSGAPVTVVPRQNILLPNFPTTAANINNWFCRIPFSTPFNYVPAAGRNLLIQITNRGNANGDLDFNYYLDANSGAGTNTSRLFSIGNPNAATGTLLTNQGLVMNFASAGATGAVPQLLAVGDPVIGNTMFVNVWQARANSVGILFLGFSNTSWNGIPLPLPLAGAGAPGCSLLVSGDVILAAATNATGFGAFPLLVPSDPSLVGGRFYNQYGVLDLGTNALGMSWTNGGRGTIGNQ